MVENGNSRPDGIPAIEQRIDNGRVFTVRQLDETGIGDGGTLEVLLRNPPTSGFNLLTISPNFASGKQAFVEKIDNPNIDTPGDTLTPMNKHISDERDATATAQVGGTNFTGVYSGGESRGREVIGATAGQGSGALGNVDLSLRLDPGDDVLYVIESNASANICSISLSFIEEPVTS